MKSILFLAFITSFLFANENSNPQKKKLVEKFKSYLVVEDTKVIGVKAESQRIPSDLKSFLKSLKDIVARKDKKAFSEIFNESPNCGISRASKQDLKKICLNKLFSNKSFWSLVSTFIDIGVTGYNGNWSAPPQLKPNRIYTELSEKLFITNWGEFPYFEEFAATYDYFLADKPLKIHKSANRRSDFKILPANHFFLLVPNEPCVNPKVQNCTPWQEIETINGKKGFVNLSSKEVKPLKSMTGLWISKKNGEFFVESVRLDSPCSSHCKPEYGH